MFWNFLSFGYEHRSLSGSCPVMYFNRSFSGSCPILHLNRIFSVICPIMHFSGSFSVICPILYFNRSFSVICHIMYWMCMIILLSLSLFPYSVGRPMLDRPFTNWSSWSFWWSSQSLSSMNYPESEYYFLPKSRFRKML